MQTTTPDMNAIVKANSFSNVFRPGLRRWPCLGLLLIILTGTGFIPRAAHAQTNQQGQGMVMAWGLNSYGQTNVPSTLVNATAVAAGNNHSLALRSDGSVATWGAELSGQTNVLPTLTNVVAIAAGSQFSLALRQDGTVVGWGYDALGETDVPAQATNVIAIAAGSDHGLALRNDGTVVAWGANGAGQANVPPNLTNVLAIAAGYLHSVAVRNDGTVAVWGDSIYGQTSVPAGLTNVIAVASGWRHNLALRNDGTVAAWGDNTYGQTNVPAGLNKVIAIAAGARHSLALRADGKVLAWGDNTYGQTNLPPGLTNVTQLALGSSAFHGLAIVGTAVFVAQPQGASAVTGTTVNFNVTVAGAAPYAYQWRFNGTNLPGATGSNLALNNVQVTNAGNYTLVVTNSYGAITSSVAVLTVRDPANITWTGSVDGDWNKAANWSPSYVPTVYDTVAINSSRVIATPASQFGTLTLNGGSLSGNLRLPGGAMMNWISGTLNGDGTLTVLPGATLMLSQNSDKSLLGVITNSGTLGITNTGNIYLNGDTAQIVNLAGGLVDLKSDQNLSRNWGSGIPVFSNAGTLRKSGGSGTTTFNTVKLNNSGTVDLRSGTLNLASGGGLLGGSFVVAPGALLLFSGDTFVSDTSVAFSGGGVCRVTAANVTANQSSSPALWDLSGGNLTLNGLITNLNVSGGTLHGTNTISAGMAWTGGTVYSDCALTVALGAELDISGANDKSLLGGLINAGSVVWINTGNMYLHGDTAWIMNQPGAWFDIKVDQSLSKNWGSGTPIFSNAGTLIKSDGAGFTTFNNVKLINSGTVDLRSGTLNLASGGGQLGGQFKVSSAAVLLFNGDTFISDSSVWFSGGGVCRVTAANVTANLASTVALWDLPGGNLTLSGVVSNLNLSGGIFHGTSSLAGGMNWTSGTLSGDGTLTVLPWATLTLSQNSDKSFHGAVTNGGTLLFTNTGNVYLDGDTARIVNLSGGLIDFQNDQTLSRNWGSGIPVLSNAGMLRKSGGSGTTTFNSLRLNNTGTVDLRTGTLNLPSGGGSLGGNFVVAPAALLLFSGDTFVSDPAVWFSGGGICRVTSANVTANLASTLAWWDLPGGNLTLSGVVSNLNLSGGILHGASSLAGAMNWTSGSLSGDGALTVLPWATLTLSQSADKSFRGAVTNGGTLLFTNTGNVYLDGDTTRIVNLPGGLIDFQNDQTLARNWGSGIPVLSNAGTLRKSGCSGATTFNSLRLNNTGTVDLRAGTLNLPSGGGSLGGSFVVAPAALLLFSGDTFVSDPSVWFSGGGVCRVTSANVTANLASTLAWWELPGGNLTLSGVVSNLNLSGGTLHGASSLAGAMNWTSGTLSGDGSLTVLPWATLTLSQSADKSFRGAVTNGGTLLFTNTGNVYLDGDTTRIVNLSGGLIDFQNDQTLARNSGSGIPVFSNAGMLRKSGGSGTTTFNTVNLGNSGAMEALSGTLSFSSSTTICGGITFGLSGPSSFGAVAVSGVASLSGGLSARLLGGYVPAVNAAFQVLTFGGRIGGFTDTNGLNVGSQRMLEPAYTSTSLTLTARLGNTNSTPPRLSLFSAPGGLTLSLGSDAGRVLEVLQSSVLNNWTPFMIVTNNSGTMTIPAPSTNAPQQFYWLRQIR